MSGLEVAGLALGAVAFAISILDTYARVWLRCSDLVHLGRKVEQFRRDIATENAILRNTCENLLKHRAHPEVVARLLDGQSSTDRSALLALESSLRPDNVEVFVHNLEDMCNLIDELYKVYPKDTSNVPKKSSRSYAKKIRKKVKFQALIVLHEDTLLRSRKINNNLRKLAEGVFPLEPTPAGNKNNKCIAQFYGRVRKHAIGLYEVLTEKLNPACHQCIWQTPHDAGLRLEIRDCNTDFKDGHFSEKDSELCFRTFVSVQTVNECHVWYGMDVEPVIESKQEFPEKVNEKTASPTSKNLDVSDQPNELRPTPFSKYIVPALKRMKTKKQVQFHEESSCDEVQARTSFTHSTDSSTGNKVTSMGLYAEISLQMPLSSPIVEDLCQQLVAFYQHPFPTQNVAYLPYYSGDGEKLRIRPVPRPISSSALEPSPTCSGRTVTLKDLIRRRSNSFNLKKRLQLAIRLASSVLQLYSSEWISDDWTSDEILFLEDENGDVSFDCPMVAGSLQKSYKIAAGCSSSNTNGLRLPSWCNTNSTMLSLGIALVELWNGQCFEELVQRELSRQKDDSKAVVEWIELACNLADGLQDNAMSGYAMAVRRCIRGVDHPEKSFEKAGYMEAVYAGVVCPLREVLTAFD